MSPTGLSTLCTVKAHCLPSRLISKGAVVSAVVFLLGITLTACGFRPLYSHAGGASSKALASVAIARIKDRSGQKLRNFLLERMAPGANSRGARYTLAIELGESRSNINIRKDESATRENLSITADFVLTHTAGKNGVFKGRVLSTNSYNLLDSDFATLSAENDARNRALRSLAEEIRLRVATALRNPSVFTVPEPAPRRQR